MMAIFTQSIEYALFSILQSIFSPAARRHPLGESRKFSRPRRWAKNGLD
jgi:hypothetical protein